MQHYRYFHVVRAEIRRVFRCAADVCLQLQAEAESRLGLRLRGIGGGSGSGGSSRSVEEKVEQPRQKNDDYDETGPKKLVVLFIYYIYSLQPILSFSRF